MKPATGEGDDELNGEKDTRELIIKVAERLFRQMGFHKAAVADIARELHMSSANVYRFFAAKSEINEAVCIKLLGELEAEAEKIAASRSTAAQKLLYLMAFIKKTHDERSVFEPYLHDLIDSSIIENWTSMQRHKERLFAILEQIIARGMASGEFPPGDARLAAHLVSTVCIRFWHPRLIVEYRQEPEPTMEQMIGFCLAAMANRPV